MTHTTLPRNLALALLLLLSACGPSAEKGSSTADSTNAAADERPIVPDEGKAVDLARWSEQSYADFGKLFADFGKHDPPIIRGYGICDSITCVFPSTDATARAEILICDLDAIYSAEDAFRLLGIETGRVLNSEASWVSLAPADDRFTSLKYKTIGSHADRTQQLLLQFKR